ncbi:MAG: hypothetical protein M3535_08110 [Actinomycetota bacterium]|nr:hypothetical protein [Actinomycetota bacterium]
MSSDERVRHELYQRLEEVLGVEHATALMEHLPAHRDVATKADVRDLVTKVELEVVKQELTATFRKELSESFATQTRTIVFALFGAMATSSGLAFAAARLV